MKKLLVYYNFLLISFMIVSSFVFAESYPQLVSATLFFPLLIYFAKQVVPQRKSAIILDNITDKDLAQGSIIKTKKQVIELEKVIDPTPGKVDKDRRAFIKLIGTAGLSVFIFSIFGVKKAQAAFFGSVPGPGVVAIKDSAGNQIDPAEKKPTDGYNITELDDSVPAYYGFTNKVGAWFIMKEESSGAYRYAAGSTNFATNWTGRAGLTYDYFSNIF